MLSVIGFAKVVTTLSCASRAVTVTAGARETPEAALVGCCVKLRCVAAPGVMLNAADVAGVGPVFEAVSVYPVPALSIEMSANCDTPWTAATVVVPVSEPPPALLAMESVIPPVKVGSTLSWASSAETTIAGVIAAPATALVGSWLNAKCVAAPGVPVAVMVTGLPESPAAVAVRVFVPAVLPRVQLVTAATPAALVSTGVVGATTPPPPVTANVTAAPGTGLPLTSFTMTDGEMVTAVATVADCAPPPLRAMFCAAPGSTTTTGVCVMSTPPIFALTVFDSATVDAREPVATPPASVTAPGWVRVLPLPVAARTTVAPATGLPLASRAVTVTVDAAPPAVMGDAAATDDCAAETAPDETVNVPLVCPVNPAEDAASV